MAPSTDWKERSDPGETERFERYAKQLRELQQKRAAGRPALRGLHAKGNLGAEAELTVLPDLPEPFRQALFARPATYKAYVRYSNGAGALQNDKKPDVRGIAVKVVGVPGKKIIPGMESAPTQDFLMIRASSQPFKNADEFVPFVLAMANPATALFKLLGLFGFGKLTKLMPQLLRGLGAPMGPLAATPYYTALPLRFGPYAARLNLQPHDKDAAAPRPPPSAQYLGDELATRLEQGPVTYDLRVQLFEDEARTPIEDASVDWPESVAPYTTVARLTLLQQDVRSERGKRVGEFIERLSFDPWHALEELRPLGNMMRARNAAYRESTSAREAAREPDGTERFDGLDARVG